MTQPTQPKKKINRAAILIAIAVLVVACIVCLVVVQFLPDSTETASSAKPTTIQIVSTTAAPTHPAQPTSTPAPTNTPLPTKTPKPTSTPTEIPSPTPLPEPVLLSGSGDNVIDFDNPFEYSIVHITGNKSGRHFAVTNYDANGNSIDLLVNTTDPYDGIRPLDFTNIHTTRFEIKATGDWTIEVLPVISARILDTPGTIEGDGDDVFLLNGGIPDLAHITGNQASRHFAVIGYGTMADLLVNTTDTYDGSVTLSPDTRIIEVKGEGPWTIEITVK